jgi:hypothetical protein
VDGLRPEPVASSLAAALSSGADSGRSALAELRMAAAHNRETLTRALRGGRRPNPAGDFLIRDRLRMERRLADSHRELTEQYEESKRLLESIRRMEAEYAEWRADYQAILDSRAYRLVQAIWSVTGRLRRNS